MTTSKPVPEHVHGTRTGYQYYRCRCDDCTTANRVVVAEQKQKRLARPVPPDIHGRYSTYNNWGCRCDACTAAQRERFRRWRGPSLTELRERRNQKGGQPK